MLCALTASAVEATILALRERIEQTFTSALSQSRESFDRTVSMMTAAGGVDVSFTDQGNDSAGSFQISTDAFKYLIIAAKLIGILRREAGAESNLVQPSELYTSLLQYALNLTHLLVSKWQACTPEFIDVMLLNLHAVKQVCPADLVTSASSKFTRHYQALLQQLSCPLSHGIQTRVHVLLDVLGTFCSCPDRMQTLNTTVHSHVNTDGRFACTLLECLWGAHSSIVNALTGQGPSTGRMPLIIASGAELLLRVAMTVTTTDKLRWLLKLLRDCCTTFDVVCGNSENFVALLQEFCQRSPRTRHIQEEMHALLIQYLTDEADATVECIMGSILGMPAETQRRAASGGSLGVLVDALLHCTVQPSTTIAAFVTVVCGVVHRMPHVARVATTGLPPYSCGRALTAVHQWLQLCPADGPACDVGNTVPALSGIVFAYVYIAFEPVENTKYRYCAPASTLVLPYGRIPELFWHV